MGTRGCVDAHSKLQHFRGRNKNKNLWYTLVVHLWNGFEECECLTVGHTNGVLKVYHRRKAGSMLLCINRGVSANVGRCAQQTHSVSIGHVKRILKMKHKSKFQSYS